MPPIQELETRDDQTDRVLDRLERKVDALANEVGIHFVGYCSDCEEGLILSRDNALVCSNCTFSRPL